MLSSNKFSDDFERDAVARITERSYPGKEVSKRLGVSQYSLFAWKKKFAKTSFGNAEKGRYPSPEAGTGPGSRGARYP